MLSSFGILFAKRVIQNLLVSQKMADFIKGGDDSSKLYKQSPPLGKHQQENFANNAYPFKGE